jgi:hypothetical protein
MPGCVLRVAGQYFQVDDFLKTSLFEPCNIFHKGEQGRGEHSRSTSGMTIVVSDADGELARQIPDAIRFLKENGGELLRLKDYAGVEDLRLDFGISRKDMFAQYSYFPPELVRLAGALGIGMELSIYS